MEKTNRKNIKEVVLLFMLMGLTAFGGPAAHVGYFHDQVVKRRKWLSDQEFLDLIGTTQIIPGPNSSELAFYISYIHAGWPGLILGGLSWILPSLAMIIAFAWAYSQYGTAPQIEWVLYAVKPIVVAIILKALWFLGRKAIKDIPTAVITISVIVLNMMGVDNALLLFGGGLLLILFKRVQSGHHPQKNIIALIPSVILKLTPANAIPFNILTMFFTFLKIGSLLYGSGYVLFAFLNEEFVEELGWLTIQQIVDGVAVGQVTPGPLSSTASFLGYILGGFPGALLAELGIYLPASILVLLTWPLIPRLRKSDWLGHFLDGVNAASLGLMAVVTWQLARSALVDIPAVGIGVVSGLLVFFTEINTTFVILGAVIYGLARFFFIG